ncbi:MAG: HD domain-containing protein [Bacilli bacterium]|nr:HD domain-containing protein [Bacilli bacterium]
MKYEIFNKELSYIKDNNLKENAKIILNNLPDYFYKIQAASSGKYHPAYALGEKGLVRHTKAAVNFAINLFDIYKLDDHTKDIIIISLLIHDGLKKGFDEEQYTRFDHPLLIGELLIKIKEQLTLTEKEIEEISNNVSSHMGRWNTSAYSDVVLPLPLSLTQKLVHMCDYLASRKQISFNFDENYNITE